MLKCCPRARSGVRNLVVLGRKRSTLVLALLGIKNSVLPITLPKCCGYGALYVV